MPKSSDAKKRVRPVVRKRVGAPSKRTPEARTLILRALRLGQSYDTAALVGGIRRKQIDKC